MLVDISSVKVGDLVVHNEEIKTVCRTDFGYSEFMGITLFGDSYRLGTKKIKLVIKK